jgi:hypothetical protein
MRAASALSEAENDHVVKTREITKTPKTILVDFKGYGFILVFYI